MASPSYSPIGTGTPGAASAEQVLVMHCLKEDSIEGRDGYSLRAASTFDADLKKWAASLKHYELPLDMKSGSLLLTQTPRRLAFLRGPEGYVTLLHSSYLPEDTCKRPHSFITHALIYPRLDLLDAVSAWGATDWRTTEYPRGATKTLDRFAGVPAGGLLGEAALQAFLSPADAPAETNQSLAQVVNPGRVERDPDQRRRWVRATLDFFVRSAEPGATRGRVYVLAEPGVVALLVYAAARLLPRRLLADVSFTTFEPPHSTLRGAKARIVGGYARNGVEPSESNALRADGFVVDTFRDSYGPEPVIDGRWPLEELLTLAADGEWAKVDEVRALWAADASVAPGVTVTALADALRNRHRVAALRAGAITPEGLLELFHTRFGAELIRDLQLRARAWTVLEPVWNTPAVRREKDLEALVVEHVDDLVADLRRRVVAEPPEAWRGDWAAIKSVAPAARFAEGAQTVLQTLAASPQADRLTAEVRAELLRDWSNAAGGGIATPAGVAALLVPPDEAAFRALVKAPALPPRFAGVALLQALSGTTKWTAGPGLLAKDVADDRFAAFLAELMKAPEPTRKAALDRLFPDGDPTRDSKTVLARALHATVPLPDGAFETLLAAARCDTPAWHDDWLEGKALETLMGRLAPGSPLAQRLWAGLVRRFTPDNFDDRKRTDILNALIPASQRFASHMAPDDRARLEGWGQLNAHVHSPATEPAAAPRLAKACKAVGTSHDALAASLFRRNVTAAVPNATAEDNARKFAKILLGLLGSEDAACSRGLELAAGASVGVREAIFTTIANDLNHDRLYNANVHLLEGTGIFRKGLLPGGARSGRKSSAASSHVKIGPIRVPKPVMERAYFSLLGFMFCLALGGVLTFVDVIKIGRPPKTKAADSAPPPPSKPQPAPPERQLVSSDQSEATPHDVKDLKKERDHWKNEWTRTDADLTRTQSDLEKYKKRYDPLSSRYEVAKKAVDDANAAATKKADDEQKAKLAAEKKAREAEAAKLESETRAKSDAENAARSSYNDVPLSINGTRKADGRIEGVDDQPDFVFLRRKRDDGTFDHSFLATLHYFKSMSRGGQGEVDFYAVDFDKDGKISWTYHGQDENPRLVKRAIASGFEQNVLLFEAIDTAKRVDTIYRDTLGNKDWIEPLKNKRRNEARTTTADPDQRHFAGLQNPDELTEQNLAVMGIGYFAIAKMKLSPIKDANGAPQKDRSGKVQYDPYPKPEIDVVEVWDGVNEARPVFRYDVSEHRDICSSGQDGKVWSMGFDTKHDRLIVNYEDLLHLIAIPLVRTDKTSPLAAWPMKHTTGVRGFDFTADGAMLLSLDKGNAIKMWGMSGTEPKSDHRDVPTGILNSTCLALSRDMAGLLAVGDKQGKVTIFEYPVAGAKPGDPPFRKLVQLDHVAMVSKLEFSADGRVLAGLAIPKAKAEISDKDPDVPPTGVIRLWPCDKLRKLAKLP
jgi:GTPase-associated protein 1, N-terminal domain type 2